MDEVAPYRQSTHGLRALIALGLTAAFFEEERARIPEIMESFKRAFSHIEERFGVLVIGTLDDDETMIGPASTWPWTCYILVDAPDRASVVEMCNVVRATDVGDGALWKYVKLEARIGRPLFFSEQQ